MYNENTKKATMKYLKEKTDLIRLRVPLGTKERWRVYAVSHGYGSMTKFVVSVIENEIKGG